MPRYNPSNKLFIEDKNNDYYVDKTQVIEILNHALESSDNKFCVSRPRRMGKSFLVNILTAYYSVGCDSREAFSDLKIAQTPDWDKYLNKFNVICIDLKIICNRVKKLNKDIAEDNAYENTNKPEIDLSEYLMESINKELIENYPDLGIELSDYVSDSILKIYKKTNKQFVIIIDEYDSVVRDEFDDDAISGYLNFLLDIFKNPMIDKAIAFGYLTGILPFPESLDFSGVNNLCSSTVIDGYPFKDFIGFTEDEVKELCVKHNKEFLLNDIKKWYDSNTVDNKKVYSPLSICRTLLNNKCGYYWSVQTSYKAIPRYIDINVKGIKESIEKLYTYQNVPIRVGIYNNRVDSFNNTNSILEYLIHAGYLTSFRNGHEYFCRIPNFEVRDEWSNAIEESKEFIPIKKHLDKSKELLERIIKKDAEFVVDYFRNHVEYERFNIPKSKYMFQDIVLYELIYSGIIYNITPEVTSEFEDIEFIYDESNNEYPTLLIELKFNESVEEAMKQIEEKWSSLIEKQEKGNILKVGINYESDKKEYTCIIEAN